MANVWEAMQKAQAEQDQAKGEAARVQQCSTGVSPVALAGTGGTPVVPVPAGGAIKSSAEGAAVSNAGVGASGSAADGAAYAEVLIAHNDHGGAITEQYRALRTSLLSQYGDGKFCLMVTSAEKNEGKSVTCLNLSLVLTERQECRTLVLDCDLRKSRIATLLGLDNAQGVSDLVLGRAALRQVVRATAYPNLSVVTAGQADLDEVGKMLDRPEFAELVGQARRDYDYVLLDTPPVNAASDAGIMGRTVGDALLVVRMNKTRRESVDRAIRLLHAANVKIVGLVLTHLKYHIPNYLYRYS